MNTWQKCVLFSCLSFEFGVFAGIRIVREVTASDEDKKIELYKSCEKTQISIKDKFINANDTIFFERSVDARIVPDSILFKRIVEPINMKGLEY